MTEALVVHRIEDQRLLESMVPGHRIEIASLGQGGFPDETTGLSRKALGIGRHGLVLASFGFLFPHKGILETILAVRLIRRTSPDVLFLAPCAVVPWMPVSLMYWYRCQQAIAEFDLASNVVMIREFLPEQAAMVFLHAADVIVLPYLPTSESASAAARFALSASRPVLTTKEPIFEALGDAVGHFESATPESIAAGVKQTYDDPARRAQLVDRANQLSATSSWALQGEWLDCLFDSVLSREGARR